MDNPENPSKWDELVRELGAEAPPEPVNVPKPAPTSESPRRKVVEPPARSKPSPQSWESLAADLGLEVPPPPPPPPVAATPAHTPVETPSPLPREAESRGREERPPRRGRPPRREESPRPEESAASDDRPARPPRGERERRPRQRRDEPRRQQREDGPRRGRQESSHREREESPRRTREERPREERPREELNRDEPSREEPLCDDSLRAEAFQQTVTPEPVAEAKPTQSLGVSLWHKIFGSPDEQAERIAEVTHDESAEFAGETAREGKSREDQFGRGGRRRDKSTSDLESEELGAESQSWREERLDVEFAETGDAEDRPARTTDESGEPRRRRRRRGRGRGRRADGEQVGEGRSDDRTEPGEEIAREPREIRESRGRGGRSGRPRREPARKHVDSKDDLEDGLEEIVLDDDDDNDSDEMDLGVDDEDAGESTGRDTPAGHKSIPSWDQAIGMIVDTNLATRTERRRSSPQQSRGGSSRGRPRGGRRRKKS